MELVVAPRYLHKSILKEYRQNDPFFDIKIVSKEELQKYCYYSVKEEAIFYLMNKYGYSYEITKMLIQYLPYIDVEFDNYKIHNLQKLFIELKEEDLINVPSDDHNLFRNKNVVVIGYSDKDQELNTLLNKLNIEATFKKNEMAYSFNTVYKFEKIEEEVYFVLNQIASYLASGIEINKIFIFKRNNDYDYYLDKFAKEFGFNLNNISNDSYLSTGAFKEFKKLYEENQNIDESLIALKEIMKDDERYQDFVDIVNDIRKPDLDFNIEKDYLYTRLGELKIRKPRYDKAVEVISNPIYGKDNYIFVIGFAQSIYPKSYKDDQYLNDIELSKLNRNTAKDKTKIDEDILLDFLKSDNHFVLSYSNRSLKNKYYPSPIAKLLELNEKEGELADEFYSKKILTYIYSDLLDIARLYKEKGKNYQKINEVIEIPYDNYDNSYSNKVNAFNKNSFVKLSTTRLDLFKNCPYHYYLSKVVKFDEDDSTFYIALGNIAHVIFEHHHEKDFDFEALFEQEESKYEFSLSEKLLLDYQLKGMILEASKSILKREQYYKNPVIYREEPVDYYLDDKTLISGKIDNLVILDNQYLICIDFKTGSSSSNFSEKKFEYGLSSQLPTYTYLTSKSDKFKNYTVIGIYINHVLPDNTSSVKDEDELIYNYLKLQGRSIADLNIFTMIDSTLVDVDQKSAFVASVSTKKNAYEFRASNALISEEQFESYKTVVESLYLDAAAKIRANEFNISPLFFKKSDNACRFCPFKDICFVKPKQYVRAGEEEEGEEDE